MARRKRAPTPKRQTTWGPSTFSNLQLCLPALRLKLGRCKLTTLKLFAKGGMVVLALAVSAVPTMACWSPMVTLNAAERACCKQMAKECGSTGMPNTHSCCHRLIGPEASFLKTASAQLDHVVNASYHVSPVLGALVLTGVSPVEVESIFGERRPPGSPPATLSVLRI